MLKMMMSQLHEAAEKRSEAYEAFKQARENLHAYCDFEVGALDGFSPNFTITPIINPEDPECVRLAQAMDEAREHLHQVQDENSYRDIIGFHIGPFIPQL